MLLSILFQASVYNMGTRQYRIPFTSTLKDRAAFQLLHNRAAGLDSGGGSTTSATDSYDLSQRLQVC